MCYECIAGIGFVLQISPMLLCIAIQFNKCMAKEATVARKTGEKFIRNDSSENGVGSRWVRWIGTI
jgi:hypothetical protein